MIDGQVVTDEAETLIRAGNHARVPLIVGANDREFGMFPMPPAMVDGMLARFGADRDKVVAAYDPAGTGDKAGIGAGVMSDGAMVEPARLVARLASAAQPLRVPLLLRRIVDAREREGRVPRDGDPVRLRDGAGEVRRGDDGRTGSRRAANAYWTNFARTGDPNGGALPQWPRFSEKDDQLMDFAVAGPAAKADPWKARLDWVEKAAATPVTR